MGNPSIVLISDDSQQAQKLYELLSMGFKFCVKSAPVSPSLVVSDKLLDGFSAVVLYMSDRFPSLDRNTQDTLVRFVADGGVLLAMPFTAWSCTHRGNRSLAGALPVEAVRFFEKQKVSIASAQDWHRRKWGDETSGYMSGEVLEPKEVATVDASMLVNGYHEQPLVVSQQFGSGTSLYFNACHHAHWDAQIDLWVADPWGIVDKPPHAHQFKPKVPMPTRVDKHLVSSSLYSFDTQILYTV